MKQLGLLFFILLFIITGCATETDLGANSNIELQNKKGVEQQNKMPKEMPDDQKSIPIPTPTTIATTPTHEDLGDSNMIENEQSFTYYELRPVDQAVEDESLIEFRICGWESSPF